MDEAIGAINKVWSFVERRAEKAEGSGTLAHLVELDDVNPIFDPASMVVFGRRGAGKTHTLLHLLRQIRDQGDVGVYIDMRKMASNAGMYDDQEVSFGTRATNMLVDVVSEVHEELFRLAVGGESPRLAANLHEVGPALDRLGQSVTKVRVTGDTTVTAQTGRTTSAKTARTRGLKLSQRPGVEASRTKTDDSSESAGVSRSVTGRARIYVHLGELDDAIRLITRALGGAKLWILIDEWSAGVPYELQPVLADMLRRTFISCPSVVVKIAAIEHRAKFLMDAENVEYVGLELGSDTAETLSLDSKLVIGVDPRPSVLFMRQVLNEHYRVASDSLESDVFDAAGTSFSTQSFELLVLAAEGNPRDAINLTSRAARQAGDRRIGSEDVLRASEDYFWNTKYKNIEGTRDLERLFEVFMESSMERGVRTILFDRSDPRRGLVDKLYDRRLIHLIRSGLRPEKGTSLYDVYAVDFGSYAERILRKEMSWANDGFASPIRFRLEEDAETWRSAVLRKTNRRPKRPN